MISQLAMWAPSPAAERVLRVLPGQPGEIARATGLPAWAVAEALRDLERAGLATWTDGPDGGRWEVVRG